jgi:hypothetical protein
MKEFKKPDLNAPRYRPKKYNILNTELFKKFLKENPKYKGMELEQFKKIITAFNGAIYQEVINSRDGVELPEQLGYIFIGTCQRKVSDNPNYKAGIQYGIKTQNMNWESDQHLAKIFYTNYETKYRFKFHQLWGFTAVRDFKRAVAKSYPTEWKKYVVVDNLTQISRLFRKEKFKDFKRKEREILLEDYDEFDMS